MTTERFEDDVLGLDGQSIRSLSDLRTLHMRCLAAWPEGKPLVRQIEMAWAFRRVGCEVGTWLEDDVDRDAAQGLVDYWTGILGKSLPPEDYPAQVELAKFDPKAYEAWGAELQDQAQALYESLPDEDAREMARSLLLLLVRTDAPGRIVREAPVRFVTLTGVLARDDKDGERRQRLDEILAALEAGGVVHRVAGDSKNDARIEIVHGSLLRQWASLRSWIDELRTVQAMVKAWKDSNEDTNLLARGPRLEVAKAYAAGSTDGDLRLYVERSEGALARKKVKLVSAGLAGAVLGLIVIASMFWMSERAHKAELKTQELENEATIDLAVDQSVDPNASLSASAAPASANVAEAVAEGEAAAVTKPMTRKGDGPGQTGSLWIGNTDRPLLFDAKTYKPVKFDEIKAGEIYLSRTNIALREKRPISAETYASPPQIGLVKEGAIVMARGKAEPYVRASGTQYWLDVRIPPLVYIQYGPGREDEAKRLVLSLRKQGYLVPTPEDKGNYRGRDEIRHAPDDLELARGLASAVGERGALDEIDVSPGTLEIWLGGERNAK